MASFIFGDQPVGANAEGGERVCREVRDRREVNTGSEARDVPV